MVHDLTKKAPLEHIYNRVATQLLGMKDVNNQPVFRHVGMWTRQPDDAAQPAEFPLPAALIELSSVEWDIIGEEEETALIILTLHVCGTQQDGNDFSVYRLLHAAGKEVRTMEDICIGEPVKISTLVNKTQDTYLSVGETYNLYIASQLLEEG